MIACVDTVKYISERNISTLKKHIVCSPVGFQASGASQPCSILTSFPGFPTFTSSAVEKSSKGEAWEQYSIANLRGGWTQTDHSHDHAQPPL